MFLSEPDTEFLEKRPILDGRYRILYTLGEGRFAKVKMALDIEENQTYAIKIIRDNQINTIQKIENFMKEIQLLSEIKHENVIEVKSVNLNGKYCKFDGRSWKVVYYVMNFAEYGELYSFLQYTPCFNENLARYYFQQLIIGLEFLHSNKIGHRDIKTENLLLNENFTLKIADFGYASELLDEKKEKILFPSAIAVGSPEYNPPEVTNSNVHEVYSAEELDLFAASTVLFMMVMKSAPFHSSSYQDPYYSRLCKAEKSGFWKIFSNLNVPTSEFKDFIEKMLASDPTERMTIKQVKEHPWYNGYLPKQEEIMEEMKSRGQSILELRRNELRNKRESKMAKLKNLENKPDDCNEIDFNKHSFRLNPKIEQFKVKHAEIIEKINKKLKDYHSPSKNDNIPKIIEKEPSDMKMEKKKKREKNRLKVENKPKNEPDQNLGQLTDHLTRKLRFSNSNERDSFKRNSSDESES